MEAVYVSYIKASLFSSLHLYATTMIYTAVISWRPQLFLLAGRCPAPVCAMPPVQSAAVNNPLGKNVNNLKMIERWKVKCDICMPCYCPRRLSQVKCPAAVATAVIHALTDIHFVSCNMHFKDSCTWVLVWIRTTSSLTLKKIFLFIQHL